MDTIIGAAIAIVSVAITKCIEIIQEKQRHKHRLKQTFFEKKLCAIEASVIKAYNLARTADNIALFYQRFVSNPQDFKESSFQTINTNLSNDLGKVSDKIDELSNALLLYSDIGAELLHSRQYRDLLECHARISRLQGEGSVLLKRRAEMKDPMEDVEIEHAVSELSKEFLQCLNQVAGLCGTVRDEHMRFLAKAREEYRKYE